MECGEAAAQFLARRCQGKRDDKFDAVFEKPEAEPETLHAVPENPEGTFEKPETSVFENPEAQYITPPDVPVENPEPDIRT